MKYRITFVLSILFLTGCMQRDTSAEWTRILDTYVEAWSTGNVEILDGIMDAQFVRIFGSTISSEGLDSMKIVITSFRETYPDKHWTIDEHIDLGDRSAARWSWTGTNSGLKNPLLKGKQISLTGLSLFRKKDGKMVEERIETDVLNMVEQLGYTLTPPSGVKE